MSRPSKQLYFMSIAREVAKQGTCKRRQVGCILVDANKHIMATGYNGVARGVQHCIDKPCPGAIFQSGDGLEKCEAIHAEQNALLQCGDVMAIEFAYCTDSPCIHCFKLLMNTSVKIVYFERVYEAHFKKVQELASKSNILLKRINMEDLNVSI